MEFSYDDFLGGMIKLKQEKDGYRATSDAITIAAAVDSVKKGARILDVGSGTGAVALCLAARFPEVEVVGIELQEKAVALANENAALNKFSERVRFIRGDIRDRKTLREESFDIVITNPPFMQETLASPDASRDMTRREGDTTLAQWLDFCIRKTKDKGQMFLLHKPERLAEILQAMTPKMGALKIYPIHSKLSEPAKKIIVSGVKTSRAKPEILHGVALHHEDGSVNEYAAAMQQKGMSLQKVLDKRTKPIDRDSE